MKVPLSWLKEYLITSKTPTQIADSLNSLGIEVDGMEESDGDIIFELGLTPNLGHVFSVFGVARELSSLTEERLELPNYKVKESDQKNQNLVHVKLECTQACPLYACRTIEVQVGPSPLWLQKRLEQLNIRSVNNVVDVTNYVLQELGQPLHAFDLDTIDEKTLIIRFANPGESLVAIDEKEYFPTDQTVLICDPKGPLAFGGIMGGKASEVSDKTSRILLESAYFEPTTVRKSSKRMGLITEGSRRFERGVDQEGVLTALDRATKLMEDVAHGKVLSDTILVGSLKAPLRTILFRLPQVERLLGLKLSLTEVTTLFSRLYLKILSTKEDTVEVEVPSYRHDLQGEIDLIEEIARLYGYDNLYDEKNTVYFTAAKQPSSPLYVFTKEVTHRLLGFGLQELLSCDLISPSEADLVSPDCFPSRSLIQLLNPSSHEQSYLRPTMLPNALKVVKYNAAHEKPDVAGFEVGRVHFKSKDSYLEPHVASIVLSGAKLEPFWQGQAADYDFFDLKGMLANLFKSFHLDDITWRPSSFETFHPGRQARIWLKDREIGIMGEVHPSVLKKAGVTRPVFFAEINLEDLQHDLPAEKKMIPLSEYPSSFRDWTVTIPSKAPVGMIKVTLLENASSLLESVSLIGIYEGEKVQPGMKNVTLRLIYRDKEKTLSLAEVDQEHSRLTALTADLLKK